ncbi:MAG: hypothetical protein JJU20_03955 [Opitutales bacterium]|nr:hypothetical protein [Opitutales bacterium]
MSKQEHLKKLHIYRPSAMEAGDRSFADALKAAESDAELKAFLAREQQFDRSVQEALRGVPAPEGLRDQILKDFESSNKSGPSKLLRFPSLAIGVAAVLLVATVGIVLNLSSPEQNGTSNFALPLVQSPNAAVPLAIVLLQDNGIMRSPMDFYAQDYQQLASYVSERGARPPINLPREHWRNLGVGCKVVRVINNEVSVISFEVEGDLYSLYTFDHSIIPQMQHMRPHVVTIEDEVFATWTCSGQVHVLRTSAETEKVTALLDI